VWRWVRVGLAGAAAVLLLLAVWTPSDRRGPTVVGHSVVVSEFEPQRPLTRSGEAPSLLVDRANPNVVYLSHVELTTGACKFSVSLDGGATWRPENAPELLPYTRNCALGGGHPQNVRTELKQGPDGTIYYAFQGNDPDAGGSRAVLLGQSSDGGRSWHTVLVHAGPTPLDGLRGPNAVDGLRGPNAVDGLRGPNAVEAPEEAELHFQAHVAVSSDDPRLVYVMWRRSYPVVDPAVRPPPNRAFFAVSEDGGDSFGPATQLLDFDLGSDGPRPLVVGNTVYAFYLQAAPRLPATAPTGPSPTPPLARLFVAASRDRGRTWARSEIAAARDASEPVPAYDPGRKRFYVVWHDNRRDELDAWFSSSPDAVSWSQPHLLNDDRAGTRVGQHYPQLSLSRSGRIDVAWYDWRDDPFPPPAVGPGNVLGLFTNRGKVASVYLTTSRDGGATWAPNVRVNDQLIDRTIGTWANNYDVLAPPAIASGRSRAVVAWSDTRNGTVLNQAQDIATAPVTFETVEPIRVTGLQAALVGILVGSGVAMWGALLIMRRPLGGGRRAVAPSRTGPRSRPPPQSIGVRGS
jgi:hypothetical protein